MFPLGLCLSNQDFFTDYASCYFVRNGGIYYPLSIVVLMRK